MATLDSYYSLACISVLLLIKSPLYFCKSSWVIVFCGQESRVWKYLILPWPWTPEFDTDAYKVKPSKDLKNVALIETTSVDNLILPISSLQNWMHLFCFSHAVCGTLFWQPKQNNILPVTMEKVSESFCLVTKLDI